MDTLLGTIFMVLPGIIAFYIYKLMAPTASKAMTDYERTVFGLIYNIPGMLLAWGVLSLNSHQKLTFDEFKAKVFVMPCVLIYFTLVLCVAFLCADWWNQKGHDWLLKKVNENREGKRPNFQTITPWEKFVGNEKDALLRIYPIGERNKSIIGTFDLSWVPGDTEKGVLILNTDWLTRFDEWLETPIRTYVDTGNKIVYELYLPVHYEEAKQKVNDHIESQMNLKYLS